MSKQGQFLLNGIVLIGVAAFLTWRFFIDDNWGVPQVFVIIVVLVSAVMQFVIRFVVFNDKEPKKTKKSLDKGKKL